MKKKTLTIFIVSDSKENNNECETLMQNIQCGNVPRNVTLLIIDDKN